MYCEYIFKYKTKIKGDNDEEKMVEISFIVSNVLVDTCIVSKGGIKVLGDNNFLYECDEDIRKERNPCYTKRYYGSWHCRLT